jgi:hypothetical protein
MKDWLKLYRGPCRECGSNRCCYKGLCIVCRQPADRREIVKFGVPALTADHLALIMHKCNGDAEFVLGKVHPRLMQNIKIVDGVLQVRDKKYRWIKRNDWVKGGR